MRLNEGCNYKCIFCHIPQLKPKNLDFMEAVKIVANNNHSVPQVFCLSGGEPCMVSYLEKLIKFIKKCNGNHYVSLETNGFFLSSTGFTNSLIKAGLDGILLSFHSRNRQIYEKIVGIKGAFDIIEKSLDVISKTKIDIEISIVVCEYNYKELPEIIEYLDKRIDFRGVLIASMFEKINYATEREYHVSLEKISRYIVEASKLLVMKNKEINICGVPMCYIRGFEDMYYLGQYDENRYYKKSKNCDMCDLYDYCRGIVGEYAELYGTDSVLPIHDVDALTLEKLKKMKFDYLSGKNIIVNNSSNY